MVVIRTTYFVSPLIFSFILVSLGEELITKTTYRVATVEYEPVIPKNAKPIEILLENANRYSQYAAKAAENNAEIIVFPEFGLSSIENLYSTRNELIPFTQHVPDPSKISWNPCLSPNQYDNSQILQILSCAAHNNSIALLANLISQEYCNRQEYCNKQEYCDRQDDSNCPVDGFYLFNTNVVFDKNGSIIARYHKRHLFFEPLLDAAVEPEYISFDINGIKFGTFTCFDIYYEDPAIKLVTERGIRNIIFSTAWGNQMPFITGVQVFSRWARGLAINLIVSNYYKPQYGRLGTGVYSSQEGSVADTFDISKNGSLLIADLPVHPSPIPQDQSKCSVENHSNEESNQAMEPTSFVPFEMTNIPSSQPVAPIHKVFYQNIENFTKIPLNENDHSAILCHDGTCCNLQYDMINNNDSATYALVAYSGVHVIDYFHAGMTTCAVMRCENILDIQSCAQLATTNSSTHFNSLILRANIDQSVVFPSVVNTNMELVTNWQFSRACCVDGTSEWIIKLEDVQNLKSASIYARVYSRDKNYQIE